MASKERWAKVGADMDWLAAATYLSLLADKKSVAVMVRQLRRSPVVMHRANDLLRASSLPLLPIDDPKVVTDLKKVKKGKLLAIVLLVRGRLEYGESLTVADGYHRICASYHLDEDTDIPCQIADRFIASRTPARSARIRTAS